MSLGLLELRSVCDRFHDSLTLADLTLDDQPLVLVNRAFRALTGYEERDILGRNCRFLQGPGTSRDDVARVREAIAGGMAVFCDLRNYRADGAEFFNRLVLLPLELEERPHVIGLQLDSTSRVAGVVAKGGTFDAMKASEEIRDRVNTPLMKIWSALALAGKVSREPVLQRSFGEIAATVRALPFRT